MNPYQHSEYFEWLCSVVGASPNGAFYPYRNLLVRLFQTPFEECRHMDDNRDVNGRLLRYYFEANRYDYASHEQAPCHGSGNFYEDTKTEPCSMLEMLIAFAKDIDVSYLYSTESRAFIWFWIMIDSMGLSNHIDGYWDTESDRSDVDWILHSFNVNAHQYDDYGNWLPTVQLFPIHNKESFEKIGSLWEQMQVWYNEQTSYLDSLNADTFINYYTCMHIYG